MLHTEFVRNSQGVTVNDNGCMNFASLRVYKSLTEGCVKIKMWVK